MYNRKGGFKKQLLPKEFFSFPACAGSNVMKRKCFDNSTCPIARTLDVIGDWWSLLIVRDAFLGKRRFCEFQKSLGLAKNILCVRLQKLVSHGVLTTGPASDGSAYQEYI